MWQRFIKFWLSFSRKEQLSLILLSIIFAVILGVRFLAAFFISPPNPDLSKVALLVAAEINQKENNESTHIQSFTNLSEANWQQKSAQITPFYFDPNTISPESLSAMGLTPSQVQNIVNYRAKGGKFRHPDDIAKLFTINEKEAELLKPYIRIYSEKSTKQTQSQNGGGDRDNSVAKLEVLELNSADSAALLTLPGSGPYTVQRIIRYRQLLGGFANVEQLLEVRGIDSLKFEAMRPWVYVNSNLINKLRINFIDFRNLIRHPYLEFEQVKAIVNYRDRKGFLRNEDELLQLKAFDSADLERLKPYLRFD